jgi:rare lipoprotein A
VIRLLIAALLSVAQARAETASVYGGRDGLCGSMTASGERYSCSAMTAAHRTLAFNTWVRVTHAGRSVTVRINDRGPYVRGRTIDISPAAAKRIGCDGVCEVQIETTAEPYRPTNSTFRGAL